MTEKEKAAKGLLYDANFDEEILAERVHAKNLTFEYNQTSPNQEKERKVILEKL